MQSPSGAAGRSARRDACSIAVLAALASEKRAFRSGLSADNGVVAIVSGPGSAAARDAAEHAVAAGATGLMSWGLAGGLVPEAHTGMVVLPATVVAENSTAYAVDPQWSQYVRESCAMHSILAGDLATVPHVLCTSKQKRECAATHHVTAADMESGAIAAVAGKAGIPFVVVRVIVDGGADELPANIESYVDRDGNVDYRGPLRDLLRKPSMLPELIRIARRSASAHRVLRDVASKLGERGLFLRSRFGEARA